MTRILALLVSVALILGVFWLDTRGPVGLCASVGYVSALLAALWSPRRSDFVLVAVICVTLTVAGLFLAGAIAADLHVQLINRTLAVFALATATVIGLLRKHGEEHLSQRTKILEETTAKQTQAAEQREAELDQTRQALRELEAHSRSLVESLPLNLFQKDPQGRFVFANHRCCETIGKSWSEMAGRTDHDLFEPALAEKYRRDDSRVMEYGEPLEDIESFKRADGQWIHVQVFKAPVRNAANEIVGVQGMFWDVTPRIQAEEARRRSDARSRALVDSSLIGVVIAKSDGRIVEANDAFLRIFGYARADVQSGAVRWDNLAPRGVDALDESTRQQLARRGVCTPWEREYTRKDGTLATMLVGAAYIVDSDDDWIGYVLDISERKRAEQMLREAKEAADSANQAKTKFLSNMSHQILTPLHQVIGLTEGLQKTAEARHQGSLSEVLKSANSLQMMFRDLLTFSESQSNELWLEKKVFSLYSLIEEALRAAALPAHSKGLELVCDLDVELPYALVGDATRVRLVFDHLLSNAVKYTRQGEIVLRGKCESIEGDVATLHFTVADTGVGIPEEYRAAVFFPFEQVANSKVPEAGTGLGLSICASLVRLMDGRIWVESELGKGSVFHFTAKMRLADEPTLDEESLELAELTVLAVDGNTSLRRWLKTQLARWGMSPSTAATADEARQRAQLARDRGEPYDMLLVSARLPDADGLALARQLLVGDAPETGVMMLYATQGAAEIESSRAAGASGVVFKPLVSQDLFNVLWQSWQERDIVYSPEEASQHRVTRVLLAEDSALNQKLLTGLLAPPAFEVSVASNGRLAVEAFQHARFDLVIMDIQMPEMDGLEATRAIRRWELAAGRPACPVLALSAHATRHYQDACHEAGMNDFLSKANPTDELWRKMARLLGRRVADLRPRHVGAAHAAGELIHWDQALKFAGGNDVLLRELAECFLAEAPPQLEALRQAVLAGDAKDLKTSAHKLRGSVRLFAAPRLDELSAQLENMGTAQRLEEVADTFARFEETLRRAIREINDYLLEESGAAQAASDSAPEPGDAA